ncbi:hypothetical protein DMUE_1021 [Dictyocoela muelleri]|nr:hypothetical protein DMUE_1021 [Dictyocoela muelleri]
MKHRSHKLTPSEALKSENRETVIRNLYKYKNEFKKNNIERFYLYQDVIIKNELKKTKMDLEYKKIGKVMKILSNNTYEIELKDGKTYIRHGSQIKPWPGNVGCNNITYNMISELED